MALSRALSRTLLAALKSVRLAQVQAQRAAERGAEADMRAAQAAVKAAEAEMLVAQASAAVASAQLAEAEALGDEHEQSGRAGTAAALGGAAGSLPLILATGVPSFTSSPALLCQHHGCCAGSLSTHACSQCSVVVKQEGFASASSCNAPTTVDMAPATLEMAPAGH